MVKEKYVIAVNALTAAQAAIKNPRKVLRERLKKHKQSKRTAPVSVTGSRGGFCMRGSGRQGNIPTMSLPAFYGEMRKQKAGSVVERRRKATLPAV